MSEIMNITSESINDSRNCRSFTAAILGGRESGLLHARLFADAGFKVIVVSTDFHTIEILEKGRTSITRNIHRKLRQYAKEGILRVSSNPREAASESDIIVVATQPSLDRNKKPDYRRLERQCRELGMGLRENSLVLFVCSTGPGVISDTVRRVLERASGLKAGSDFGVALSPYRPSSENEADDARKACRVVGAIDQPSSRVASLILRRITAAEVIEVSNIKTAEATCLFQSLNVGTNLAIANELALLCEQLGIDILEVSRILDNQNTSWTRPGIMHDSTRVDLGMLLEEVKNLNVNLRVIPLAEKANEEIAGYVLRLVKKALKATGKTVRRAKVSVLGISQQADSKGKPKFLTRRIVDLLKRKVRTVDVYDPMLSKKKMTDLGFEEKSLSRAIEGTDCVLFLTGHSRFGRMNLRRIKLLAKENPAIVDFCNILNPSSAEKAGFTYYGLGRGVRKE